MFLPAGSEGLLPIVLSGVLDPDVRVRDAAAPLRVTHRRIDRHEIYFVINDSPKPWRGEVEFAAGGHVGVVGSGKRAGTHTRDPGRPIALALEPYGAVLVRFSQPPSPSRHRLTSGDLPNLTVKPLPRVMPTMAHGEFVTDELHQEPAASKNDEPKFDATARLTRSNVDSHMFVKFHYDTLQMMGSSDCLVVDIWVPQAKKTAQEFLVILHEEGGG